MNKASEYISVNEAAAEIGVNRSTMYYYMKQLDPPVTTKKFPLDKSTYISQANFERIKAAKQAAKDKRH